MVNTEQAVSLKQASKHDPHAEAALQAVQAALHAASVCATDDLRLAWMKLHVPSVSTAVSAYVISQSGIRLKRMSILKQLMAGQGEASSEKLAACLKAETELYWQLCIVSKIAAFLAPLSTAIRAPSESWYVFSSSSSSTQQQEQRKRSYRQRDELLENMAFELVSEYASVVKPLKALEQLFADTMGVTLPPPNTEFFYPMQDAIAIELQASLVWLRIALSLPPSDKHAASASWLEVVSWEAHMFLATRPDVPHELCAEVLCDVLARTDLYKRLNECGILPLISNLLYAYGVRPKQLRKAGVLEEAIQQLPPVSQSTRQILAEHKITMKERYGWGSRKEARAAGGSSSCDTEVAAVGHDSSLDEMQALVMLMYGKLDIKG